MVVVEEVPECQRQAGILGKGSRPRHKPGGAVIGGADIIQHILCGNFFQLNIAAFGCRDKALFKLPTDAAGGVREQCCEFLLKIILFVGLPDEIQNGQAILVFCQTQTTPQLLQKHGQRLGRAQEQHSVHLGDIHTLVVNVHHKEESELPGNQPLLGGVALLVRRVAGQCHRWNAVGIKVARHELGMSDGNAEAQTLYLVDIGDIFQDGAHHKVSAALRHHAAEGVQVGQFVFIVAAGTPFQAAQICGVGDAEILEGTK